jgi:streptomycin 6-kinase
MSLPLRERLDAWALVWRVDVAETRETETALLAFGNRDAEPVVLKVRKALAMSGAAGLRAFAGGVARVIEHDAGALLLERIAPGDSLVGLVLAGRDGEATDALADVIRALAPRDPPAGCPTVTDWGAGFARYVDERRGGIQSDLVRHAAALYSDLCETQRCARLLHGDLHHYNVLSAGDRGWLAIDPKGVVGELEYEIGAALRNPIEHPDLFTARAIVKRRLERLAAVLPINFKRALGWTFAQAVLSALWEAEDGGQIDERAPVLQLAYAIRPMLRSAG